MLKKLIDETLFNCISEEKLNEVEELSKNTKAMSNTEILESLKKIGEDSEISNLTIEQKKLILEKIKENVSDENRVKIDAIMKLIN